MKLGKFAVSFAKDSSLGILSGVKAALVGSFEWSAKSLSQISEAPLVKGTKLEEFLRNTGKSLQEAGSKTEEGLSKAFESTSEAMYVALQALNDADSVIKKKLFENISVSSIVGESFAGLVTTSEIKPSFRLEGKDVSVEEVLADWKKSGSQKPILCVPGLFCDEGLWKTESEISFSDVVLEEGYYPFYLRFNPGSHISDNGSSLLDLMREILEDSEIQKFKLDVLSYSQGGLIFRSALNLAKEQTYPLPSYIKKVLFISSPDGGSYIEKIGFWLGLGAESLPVFPVQLVGYIGNQRSDAMKDLSHGIIREQDWKSGSHLSRYWKPQYFGELDDIDAYQIYSFVAEEENPWSSWIGDGIVEQPSLTLLSDSVFRKKENPEGRVRGLKGLSHYQIMPSTELREYFLEIFGSKE
ncbi:alpha/beta hydrolase [Leptospira langatensis]|uniref:Alpha/beta hydrolase n=1 Tax=Leptospira langatensis TaxID=2484983 RepID=A0A5F1ZQ91_9LEPT|nr:alpha/beta hydrolase [Leptospira langatensis]TGK02815.1 alpha/beta hydrolase [Leptospira langatensis]TGL39980.1 alpha/beta hydrolase [Leptospira langatensis]